MRARACVCVCVRVYGSTTQRQRTLCHPRSTHVNANHLQCLRLMLYVSTSLIYVLIPTTRVSLSLSRVTIECAKITLQHNVDTDATFVCTHISASRVCVCIVMKFIYTKNTRRGVTRRSRVSYFLPMRSTYTHSTLQNTKNCTMSFFVFVDGVAAISLFVQRHQSISR